VIWLLIFALLFRPVRGCLKAVLLLMLIVWVWHRHPDVARDVGQLFEGVERKAKELLDEQSNVSSDRTRVVAPSPVPLPVELSAANSAGTVPSRGNNHRKGTEYPIPSHTN
jgi:hypothetical protein